MPTNNQKHYQLSDAEFEQQFANCTIDPTLFSHEAHVRLTWIHLKKYGMERTINNMQKQISDFARFHIAKGKYHTTITVAAVQIINLFMQKSNSILFKEFIKEHRILIDNFKNLLGSHYSKSVLHSETAKTKYIEPDLINW